MIWPPPYTLKPSTRARSVRLQMCSRRGLQLTVPQRFDLNEIPNVLLHHRRWIEKTWQRLKPPSEVVIVDHFPQELNLLAIGEIWKIQYQSSSTKFISIETKPDHQLIIYGNISNPKKIKNILLKWLQSYAHQQLLPWLHQLSQQTGLNYTRATIRNGTSRWGSCSAKKTISLNPKLLFLAPHLAKHIMLHELCHTIHLNHSRSFWELLKSFDSGCHLHKKEIKLVQNKLPLWLE